MVNLISQGFGGGGQVALGTTPPKSAEVALPLPVNTAPSVPQQVQVAQVSDQTIEDIILKRTDSLKQSISAALPRFFSPVSEVRFTIYKDPSGQYITKFTNIASGATSQVPEPELLSMIAGNGISGQNLIQTSA